MSASHKGGLNVVGYRTRTYGETRNIIGAVPGVRYKRMRDLYWLAYATWYRLGRCLAVKSPGLDLSNQCFHSGSRADVLHLFNGVNYGRTPWVSTFEMNLPRFESSKAWQRHQDPRVCTNRKILRALKAVASRSCIATIAMSKWAAGVQVDFLRCFGPTGESAATKIVTIHPPQAVHLSGAWEKNPASGSVRFMFVGASFHRKGGVEALETLCEMRRKHSYPIELSIVSSLQIDNYATYETEEDIRKAEGIIRQNSAWVRFSRMLPNEEVLRLMREHHVGLLPTYADTYGYSVLEFQAAGCPVITTDVAALPEINGEAVGWTIPVSKNHLGEANYLTRRQRDDMSAAIRRGIAGAVHEIFQDRTRIAKRGDAAIRRILQDHSPVTYAEKLRHLYAQAAILNCATR